MFYDFSGNNYAAPDCGAKVISYSQDVQHASYILSSNLDDYMQVRFEMIEKSVLPEHCFVWVRVEKFQLPSGFVME